MTKKFTLLQLFNIVDGRLSTTIDDVYEILNHVTGDTLMTHHLPVAHDYLKEKNPKWFQIASKLIASIKASVGSNDFKTVINVIKEKYSDEIDNVYDIPQLKDEFDTSDFGNFMIDNSLLLKKANG